MANIRLVCLDERFIPFSELNKAWKVKDKRNPEQAIHRFISFNKRTFIFLGIEAAIQDHDGIIGLNLKSRKFVGSAPLRSPVGGKHYLDIEVTSRFGEDVAEVANLLQESVEPEYLGEELLDNNQIKAPVYLDCVNYFNVFLKAIHFTWNKFDTIRKDENTPSYSTNWKRYAEHSHEPSKILVFNNRKSIQSKNHVEWYKLTYIAKHALDLFLTPNTPPSLKCKVKILTDRLKSYVTTHNKVVTDKTFQISNLDPAIIKELKRYANILIERKIKNRTAWRIDSSFLFERYVQYIMQKVAQIIGGYCMSNSRFSISGNNKPSWCLRYLEPDILLSKENSLFAADAKYKAHLFNIANYSDDMKETFRRDLHQVLAYSSFDTSSNKVSAIIYPYSEYKEVTLTLGGGAAKTRINVILLGITFDTKEVDSQAKQIAKLFQINLQNP